jgi:NADPH:quinone reductase-like Zn-dependent oxidoreductase
VDNIWTYSWSLLLWISYCRNSDSYANCHFYRDSGRNIPLQNYLDYIINDYDRVTENVKEITNGKMADVVLNSLGIGTWDSSFASVGINGRWVAFGGLTGADVKLNVQALYSKQIKLIGSTGGTRKELRELIDMSKDLKIRVWKKFKLDDVRDALQALFAKERDGRILLNIS